MASPSVGPSREVIRRSVTGPVRDVGGGPRVPRRAWYAVRPSATLAPGGGLTLGGFAVVLAGWRNEIRISSAIRMANILISGSHSSTSGYPLYPDRVVVRI